MRRFWTILWKTLLLTLVGVVSGYVINANSEKPLPFKRIPKKPALELWPVLEAPRVKQHSDEGTALFVDARDPKEFKLGHIPGAQNLPAEQFLEYYEKIGSSLPPEGIPIIVYCQGGPCEESQAVLEHLKTLEYKDLYLFPGGWLEWKEKNYPEEKEES